jgi:hypothetical protein
MAPNANPTSRKPSDPMSKLNQGNLMKRRQPLSIHATDHQEELNNKVHHECVDFHSTKNRENIESPDFFVWDNWGFIDEKDTQHVYSQYCNRTICTDKDERVWDANIRHFTSENQGKSWKDCGTVIDSNPNVHAFDSGPIWSGSTLALEDGRILSAYTGVKKTPENPSLKLFRHYKLQSIGLAVSHDGGYHFETLHKPALSAIRQYKEFKQKGYYLGSKKTLGIANDPDGIFMTLRDPFLFQHSDGSIHLFFASKTSVMEKGKEEVVPCVGHALIKDTKNLNNIELLEPIIVTNEKGFNQIECPNLVERDGQYYFILSTNQNDTGQKGLSLEQTVRIYHSKNIESGWEPYGKNGDHILLHQNKDNLYALNVLNEKKKSNVIKGRVFVIDESFVPSTVYLTVGGKKPLLSKEPPNTEPNRGRSVRSHDFLRSKKSRFELGL